MRERRHHRGAAVGAALFAVLGPAFGLAAQVTPASAQEKAQEEVLELVTASGTHALDVELATTPEKQALGLMYRTSLAPNKGMLFFHEGKPRELTMWMRNTYIPLDMVFIRADGTVHHIAARTEPFSERIISSQGPVQAVLEIGGGMAEKLGLKPGDTIRHRFFGAAPSK